VITDEPLSLKTLSQYALRFRVEELLLDAKSGAFELAGSSIRSAPALQWLYWVAAIAIPYATTQGMVVQIEGLRTQVDPHWTRGLSYLEIGLRWCQGVVNKGRQLLNPIPLLTLTQNPASPPKPLGLKRKTASGFLEFNRSAAAQLLRQGKKICLSGNGVNPNDNPIYLVSLPLTQATLLLSPPWSFRKVMKP
jgi:hypothetical protein